MQRDLPRASNTMSQEYELMRIRQIALVAADLEPALRDLCEVFAIDVAFRDPGVEVFGLHNGVMPIGRQFLEVVSPKQPSTSAGRYLTRRRRADAGDTDTGAGDGGYMVIFQTHDLEAERRHFAEKSVRIAWEIGFNDIRTVHLHPRDTGGAIVSMDEAIPSESWRWAGPSWHEHIRETRVTGIAGVEIQSDDPAALAARWKEIFHLHPATAAGTYTLARSDADLQDTVAQSDADSHDTVAKNAADSHDTVAKNEGESKFTNAKNDTESQWIRFCDATDGRGEGIRTVALRTAAPEEIRRAASARGHMIDSDGAVIIVGTRFLLT